MLYLLLMPRGNEPSWLDFIPYFDKIAHFSLFGVWAFLLGGLYSKEVLPFWGFMLPCLGLALLWAITTEFLQYLTGYRTADFWDVLADMCGALVGLVTLFFFKKMLFKSNSRHIIK